MPTVMEQDAAKYPSFWPEWRYQQKPLVRCIHVANPQGGSLMTWRPEHVPILRGSSWGNSQKDLEKTEKCSPRGPIPDELTQTRISRKRPRDFNRLLRWSEATDSVLCYATVSRNDHLFRNDHSMPGRIQLHAPGERLCKTQELELARVQQLYLHTNAPTGP